MVHKSWIWTCMMFLYDLGVTGQDICRNFQYPASPYTLFICKRFHAVTVDQRQLIELNCPNGTVSIGKIEIGHRDRLCQGIVNYIGCCYGKDIPSDSPVVCQSSVDVIGFTKRLLELRSGLFTECQGEESCTLTVYIQQFLELVYVDAYSIYLQVGYSCNGGTQATNPPTNQSTSIQATTPPTIQSTTIGIIGWIIAAIVLILLIVAIIIVVVIYRKRTNEAMESKVSLQKTRLDPIPSLPDVRNSNYATLDERSIALQNEYETLNVETSDYHEYLEPVVPTADYILPL